MQYEDAGWLYISRDLYKTEFYLFFMKSLFIPWSSYFLCLPSLTENISQVNFVVDSVKELFECAIFLSVQIVCSGPLKG